jgi:hypothetical protein
VYFRDVDMAEYLAPECVKDNPNTSYDLIANICYEGQTGWIFSKGGFPFSAKCRTIDFLQSLSFEMRAVNYS